MLNGTSTQHSAPRQRPRGAVWITWEPQRRNRELAAALGVELIEWPDIDRIPSRIRKYLVGITRTVKLLLRRRPRIIFCQNPSIVLAGLAVLLRRPLQAQVVVDAHNAGLLPAEGKSGVLNLISRWIQRSADLTIVSNEGLVPLVRASKGRPFVLPDRVPRFDPPVGRKPELPNSILFVTTFAADEPYRAVLSAAAALPSDVMVYVSGNYRKAGLEPTRQAAHVQLTGYLPEEDYVDLLRSVSVIMDLTDRENCLVCGAYEALAVGKPMILSDTQANRRYFSRGAIFATHDESSLTRAMMLALAKRNELASEAAGLRELRGDEWNAQLERLNAEITALAKRRAPWLAYVGPEDSWVATLRRIGPAWRTRK